MSQGTGMPEGKMPRIRPHLQRSPHSHQPVAAPTCQEEALTQIMGMMTWGTLTLKSLKVNLMPPMMASPRTLRIG